MAHTGVAGFEPTNDGVKVRCLTAWLYPKTQFGRVGDGNRTHEMPEPQSGALTTSPHPPYLIKPCLEGFEPPTLGLEVRCSIQLSYRHTAGDGNRTHVAGLEGQNSTIELHPQKVKQKLSGRRDSNPRPHGPKPRALPNCATPRQHNEFYYMIVSVVNTYFKLFFKKVLTTLNQSCEDAGFACGDQFR